MSPDQFLAEVRALVLRELQDLGPSSLVVRLDDAADRSAFVMARLVDGAAMVARVYEVDLPLGLQPVYLAPQDVALFVRAFAHTLSESRRSQ